MHTYISLAYLHMALTHLHTIDLLRTFLVRETTRTILILYVGDTSVDTSKKKIFSSDESYTNADSIH